jgi:hypothetical protein
MASFRDYRHLILRFVTISCIRLRSTHHQKALGLERDDVSFDRKTVTFRPNQWRRLKNPRSHRVAPLWAQLEDILHPWVLGRRLEIRAGSCFRPSRRVRKPVS